MIKFLLGLIIGMFIMLKIQGYEINIEWNWKERHEKK